MQTRVYWNPYGPTVTQIHTFACDSSLGLLHLGHITNNTAGGLA